MRDKWSDILSPIRRKLMKVPRTETEKRRKPTGSKAFSSLSHLDTAKLVKLSVFALIETTCPEI